MSPAKPRHSTPADTSAAVDAFLAALEHPHAEGIRGFHRKFSPRAVVRAVYLRDHPRVLWTVLAPVFCMNLMHASRRGRLVARAVVVGVALLVIGVRHVEQPYRGIIDGGVIVGLAIGLSSLFYYTARGFAGANIPAEVDLPADARSAGHKPAG